MFSFKIIEDSGNKPASPEIEIHVPYLCQRLHPWASPGRRPHHQHFQRATATSKSSNYLKPSDGKNERLLVNLVLVL